jgi:transposase-like protein
VTCITAQGEKRFLIIEDGVRESTQSWREVLRRLKERGMTVLNCLPKSVEAIARQALLEISHAETTVAAEEGV